MIHLKTDTANLLHSNPELYAVFESDKSFEMARFIHAILQKYETGRKVLDVGSGLGREVAFLSERGYDAVGIDASEDRKIWLHGRKKTIQAPLFIPGNRQRLT